MKSSRVTETRFRAIKIVVLIKLRSHVVSLITKEKRFNEERLMMKKLN